MQSSPGPFIMQCLLGCAGVSPAQHNYSLFWSVVLGSTVFRLCSVVFCQISSVLALLFATLRAFFSALLSALLFSDRYPSPPPFSFFFYYMFLNLLFKLSVNDQLKFLEQNISISRAFVVRLCESLRLKLFRVFAVNCHIFHSWG